MLWSIGVDPGFGKTGLVLCRDDDVNAPVAWATFTCPTGETDLNRACTLGGEVVNQVTTWIEEHEIKHLDISIEMPIMRRGSRRGADPVTTFMKQMRLIQEIESGVVYLVGSLVKDSWITEVNNKTSKVLAAGNGSASKPMMVRASPFRDMKANVATKEALADAWAHGLATWGVAGQRLSLQAWKAAEVTK